MRATETTDRRPAPGCATDADHVREVFSAGVPPVSARRWAIGGRVARGAVVTGAGLCLLLATSGCRSSACGGVSIDGESTAEVEPGGRGMDLETARGVVDLIGRSTTATPGRRWAWPSARRSGSSATRR